MASGAAAQDPWNALEREVDAAVQDLSERKNRFQSMCQEKSSSARIHADAAALYSDLQGAIQQTEWDTEDMAAAVQSALDHPEKFSLSTQELIRRQDFVQDMERRLIRIRDDVERLEADRRRRAPAKGGDPKVDYNQAAVDETSTNMRSQMELQASLQEEQDAAVERLQAGVKTIKSKAELIGGELKDQENMLEDLDKDMSMLQIKMEGAVKKVGRLIDNSSDKNKMICIGVLLVVLAIMIMVLLSD